LDVATDIIEQVFGVANESLDLQKNVRAAG
jgi:hypothetical protein